MRESKKYKKEKVECFRIKNIMLETLLNTAYVRHCRSK